MTLCNPKFNSLIDHHFLIVDNYLWLVYSINTMNYITIDLKKNPIVRINSNGIEFINGDGTTFLKRMFNGYEQWRMHDEKGIQVLEVVARTYGLWEI